jgi:hypothetical protein
MVAVACSEGPTGIDEAQVPASSETSVVSLEGDGLFYRCTLLRPNGNPTFQIQALDVGRWGIHEAPGRSRTTYTVESVTPDGGLVSRLECRIPATQQAGNRMHEILGIEVPTLSAEALLYDASVPHIITTRAVISIEGFHVVVDGTEPDECDPYLQLGFTCEEQCVEAENLGSLVWTMRANSCTPGGGGSGGDGGGTTGGGGGGSGGGSDPYSHEDLACPEYCRPFNVGEMTKLQESLGDVCTTLDGGPAYGQINARQGVIDALLGGEIGMRPTTWAYARGNHYPEYHSGQSSFHYSIGSTHPGFDAGVDPLVQRRELAGTMLHEFLHHYTGLGNEGHPVIVPMVKACVPGYQGG